MNLPNPIGPGHPRRLPSRATQKTTIIRVCLRLIDQIVKEQASESTLPDAKGRNLHDEGPGQEVQSPCRNEAKPKALPEPTTAKNRHPSERHQPFGVIPTGDKVYTIGFCLTVNNLVHFFLQRKNVEASS